MAEKNYIQWHVHIICGDREVMPWNARYFKISGPRDSDGANKVIQARLRDQNLLPPQLKMDTNAWLLIRQILQRGHTAILLLAGRELCGHYQSYRKAVTIWSTYAHIEKLALYIRHMKPLHPLPLHKAAGGILVGGFAVYALSRGIMHIRAQRKQKVAIAKAKIEAESEGDGEGDEGETEAESEGEGEGETEAESEDEGEGDEGDEGDKGEEEEEQKTTVSSHFSITWDASSDVAPFRLATTDEKDYVNFIVVKEKTSQKPSIAALKETGDQHLLRRALFELLSKMGGETLFAQIRAGVFLKVDPKTLKNTSTQPDPYNPWTRIFRSDFASLHIEMPPFITLHLPSVK